MIGGLLSGPATISFFRIPELELMSCHMKTADHRPKSRHTQPQSQGEDATYDTGHRSQHIGRPTASHVIQGEQDNDN